MNPTAFQNHPSTAPPTRAPSRLPGLDGLRAVAVVGVIVFHLWPDAAVGGFIGVDLFFVISGCLITTLLLREHAATGSLRLGRFWLRRARRLLPALALVLIVSAGAAFLVGGDVTVGLGLQLLGAATFSSNWVSIAAGFDYFDATTPDLLRNLWSLAVEEQFYLLWPLALLLVLRLPRRRHRTAVVAALALASAGAMLALALGGAGTTRLYYGTDTHAFGLALGAALALSGLARTTRTRYAAAGAWPALGTIALAGLIAAAVLMPESAPLVTRGGLLAVTVLAGLALLGAVSPGSWLGRALDVRPLAWVGERSYGLYLWHWPALVLADAALAERSPGWIPPLVALAVTVLASVASYRFVEMPIRRLGFRGAWRATRVSARPRQVVAAGVAVALAVSAIFGGVAVVHDTGRGEAQAAIEAGQDALRRPPEPRPEQTRAPLTGDEITAVGDSVMLASAPALQDSLPGIDIDAVVSRQMREAPDIVEALVEEGRMRHVLLLGLGTNGPVDRRSLDAVRDALPRDTLMVVVNVEAPRDWVPGVNRTVEAFASRHRDVELCNWKAAIAQDPESLASDGVHPGGRISTGIYVDAVESALQRLAQQAPERTHEDRWYDRPV